MKTSKFFLSTLVAAAAMTSTAYAEDVSAVDSDQAINLTLSSNAGTATQNLTIAEGKRLAIGSDGNGGTKKDVTFSGSTISISGSDDAPATDLSGFAWLGALSVSGATNPQNTNYIFSNVTLSGTGDFAITTRTNGNNGGVNGVVDLSGLNTDSAFKGRLLVVNQWERAMNISISGTALKNTEYLFGSLVHGGTLTGAKAVTGGDCATNVTYNLILTGDASLAGISGSTNATYFANEKITASAAGTTLTLTGGDAEYNGYSGGENPAFVYNGAFGTSTTAIGLSVTGGNQTLGGTNYVSSISVSGGELALTGTNTISGMVFVMGGELSVSGDSVITGSVGVGGMGSAAVLSLDGNVALSNAIGVGGGGTLTFEDGVEITADSTLFTDVVTPEGNGYATVSITIYTEDGGTITNGSSFEMVVNGETVTVNNGVVSGATDYSTYYVNADNAATFGELASSNTALKSIVVKDGFSLSIDQDYTWGTYAISGNATIATDATVDVGNVTSAKMDYTQLKGDGTVKFKADATNHAHGIMLGSDFTGTVIASGNLNLPVNTDFGGATKVVLKDAYLWSNASAEYNQAFEVKGTHTNPGGTGLNKFRSGQGTGHLIFNNTFTLKENASFGVEQGTFTFNGNLSGEAGSSLNITNTGTVNINGAENTLAGLSMTAGTVNFSGTGNTTITSATVTGGTLSLNSGTSVSFGAVNNADSKTGTLKLNTTGEINLDLDGDLYLSNVNVNGNITPSSVTIDFGTSGSITTANEINFGKGVKFSFKFELTSNEKEDLLEGVDVTRTLLKANGNSFIWNIVANADAGGGPEFESLTLDIKGLDGYSCLEAGLGSSSLVLIDNKASIADGMYGLVFDKSNGQIDLFINSAPIPEPSAFGLLAGVGALALVAARRRRRK